MKKPSRQIIDNQAAELRWSIQCSNGAWSLRFRHLYHAFVAGTMLRIACVRLVKDGRPGRDRMPDLFSTRRRAAWPTASLWSCAFLFGCATVADRPDYREYDIDSLQVLMQQGELTSEALTRFYLDRIDAIDRSGPKLNAIIEVNPDAIEIAAALDDETLLQSPELETPFKQDFGLFDELVNRKWSAFQERYNFILLRCQDKVLL